MWQSVLVAVVLIAGIALFAGLFLGYASKQLPSDENRIVDEVNALLPQTQCAQCGFPGCRPYARAIVAGEAQINLCPPGGQQTMERIADLMGADAATLVVPQAAVGVARIEETQCIGCAKCRDACPVDAITGAQQFMHTIIAAECTGCELCISPCPVDCISMVTRT